MRTQTDVGRRRNLDRYTRGAATHQKLLNTSAKSGELNMLLKDSVEGRQQLNKLETGSSGENLEQWAFSSAKKSPPKSSPGKRRQAPEFYHSRP